jgi:hypothetical protein
MWLGRKRNSNQKVQNISSSKSIKVLGIFIGHKATELIETNLETKLKEIASVFNLWKSRNLTIGDEYA